MLSAWPQNLKQLLSMLSKNDRRQPESTAYFKSRDMEDSTPDTTAPKFRPRLPSDRKLKHFLSSKHQELESYSVCPSIQKQLPQASSLANSDDRIKEENLQKIALTYQLKEEALAKAETMIDLLVEENNEYKTQINKLKLMLREKDQLIQYYSRELEELKQASSEACIKDLMKQGDSTGPRRSQNGSNKIKSKSELFFQFTHPHRRQMSVYKSQNKVINPDNLNQVTLKDINGELNFSKKLSPYVSRINEEMESSTVKQLMSKISVLLVEDEIEGNRSLVQELMEVICQEEEAQDELQMELQRKSREIIEQGTTIFKPSEGEGISKRLFTLQKHTSPTMASVGNSTLISSYQKIIQDYKQYAAYLKAYLCECINYISEISHPSSQRGDNSISHLLKMIVKDIKQKLNGKLFELKRQNEELKTIMEELIRNIQITHKQEESVGPWNSECGLNMKELQ